MAGLVRSENIASGLTQPIASRPSSQPAPVPSPLSDSTSSSTPLLSPPSKPAAEKKQRTKPSNPMETLSFAVTDKNANTVRVRQDQLAFEREKWESERELRRDEQEERRRQHELQLKKFELEKEEQKMARELQLAQLSQQAESNRMAMMAILAAVCVHPVAVLCLSFSSVEASHCYSDSSSPGTSCFLPFLFVVCVSCSSIWSIM